MDGTMTLSAEGQEDRDLQPGDAFVIPPDMMAQYKDCSENLELLEVALRGDFSTKIV
jgi:mannose-6-phosphate isomerase-like protein (cupin superfamily)